MAKVGIYPVEFTASIRLFLVTKTEVTIDTFALGLRFDAGTTYTVELEEGFVKETGANKFDSPAVGNLSQFTTNSTGPQIQVDEPQDGGTAVTNNTFIRYTYDRQILAGNGNYYLYKETGSPDEEVAVFNASDSTGRSTISGNQITLDVTGLMRAGETYYVLIDEGAVEDRDGLAAFGFDNDQEHRWTTALSTGDFPDLSATLTGAFTPTVAINYQAGFVASQSMVATINCSAGRITQFNSQMTSQSTINLTGVTWVMYSDMSSSFTMPAVFTEATVPASASLQMDPYFMDAFGHRGEYGQTLTFTNTTGLESMKNWRGYGNTSVSLDLYFDSSLGSNLSYNIENSLYPSLLDNPGMFYGGDEFSVGKNKRWVISYKEPRSYQNYTSSSTNFIDNNFYFTFYENTNSTWSTSGNYEYKQHFTQDDVFTSSEISELSGSNSQYYTVSNEFQTLHMSDTEEYAVSVVSAQSTTRPYLLLFSKSGSTWSVSKKNILNLPNLGFGSPGYNTIPDVKISGNGQYIFVRHNTATDTKLYIYHNNNGTLTLQQTIDSSILQAINSNFQGIYTAIDKGQFDVNYDGTKLALNVTTSVFRYSNSSGGSNQTVGTHILIFTRSGSAWSHNQTIDSGTRFGTAIAISGIRMNTSGTRILTEESSQYVNPALFQNIAGTLYNYSDLTFYDFETNVGFERNGRLRAQLNYGTSTNLGTQTGTIVNHSRTLGSTSLTNVEFDYANNNIILWEQQNGPNEVFLWYNLSTPTI